MKLFLDTNILVTIAEEREGAAACKVILSLPRHNDFIRVCTSFLSAANLAYIERKKGAEEVSRIVHNSSLNCNILPMNDMVIHEVGKCKSPDFEDRLQIICAEFEDCDFIITYNKRDYEGYTNIPVFTPEDFIAYCKNNSRS